MLKKIISCLSGVYLYRTTHHHHIIHLITCDRQKPNHTTITFVARCLEGRHISASEVTTLWRYTNLCIIIIIIIIIYWLAWESIRERNCKNVVCVTRRLVTLDLWAVPFQLWFFSFSYNRDFSVAVSVTVMYFLCFS